MKVLLVRPSAPNKLSFINILNAEPLELEYLHTGLANAGYEDYIYDYICADKPFDYILKSYIPDVVAITGYITQENVMKKLCKKTKSFDKNIKTIVGGVHAQLNYHRFYDDNIDFIARSESIDAFVDIIRYLDDKTVEKKSLFDINGLCFKNNEDKWQVNHITKVDINSILIPDRSFFYENKHNFRYLDLVEIASIKTSFGCPYSCNFCYCTLLNGSKYQARNMDLVIEELKQIKVKNIQILDDDFLFDINRIREFIRLVKKNNIQKTYVCYARADFISQNEDIVCELVSIGFKYFLVGLEAISDKDLQDYNKGTKAEHNINAVKVLKRAGGECIALMIMGLKAEKKDFEYLYDWVVKNDIMHVTVSMFTPIPGTPLYDEYKDRLITDDIEQWDFLHLVVNPENISKSQFYRYYRKMIIKLYKRAKKAGLYDFIDISYYKSMLSRYLLRKIYLDR